LENLVYEVEINRAREIIRQNMKTSECRNDYMLKQRKP